MTKLSEEVARLSSENKLLHQMILEDRHVINKLAEEILHIQLTMPGNDKKKMAIDFRRHNERQ